MKSLLKPLAEKSQTLPVLPKPPLPLWTKTLMVITLCLGLFFWWEHHTDTAMLFISMAVFIFLTGRMSFQTPFYPLTFIGLGWALFTISVGHYHNFNYAFSWLPNLLIGPPGLYFAVGMGLMVAFWRFLPLAHDEYDISKAWARIWFWAIFAVAAFMRLRRIHDPMGGYWDDNSICIMDPRDILEFHDRYMFVPTGNREPFFSYYLAALWSFMPNASIIFIHRLGSAIIDLTGVWLFYLLGKEIGGRRAGLVAAGLAAVSKPMIICDLLGYTQVTVPMAVALTLLMTMRLFKKPDWNHFIKWGLALGFMPYNYTAVRPWLPYIAGVVLCWIWFYKQKEGKGKWDFLLGWGTLLTWVFAFLLRNNFLPMKNGLIVFLNHGWVGLAAVVILWYFFKRSLSEAMMMNRTTLLPRFFLGIFLAAVLAYPLASSPLLAERTSALSIFHNQTDLTVNYTFDAVRTFFDKIWVTLQTIFAEGKDLSGDAIFDFHFIPIFILGLVSLLARPNWMKIFLLVCFFAGISPHVLSIDPHVGKLVGIVVPLSVLSGLGVRQICSVLRATREGRSSFMFIFLLIAYFGWAICGTYDKVWKQWFSLESTDRAVSHQVAKYAPQDRVYIALYPYFVSPLTQTVLDQGLDFHSLAAENPIPLKTGEAPKDVVVIMSAGDAKTKALIEGQFKNVSWEDIRRGGYQDILLVGRRAVIPAAEISEKPGKLFYFQGVPAANWTRDYFMGRAILGYGMIEREESVPSPYDPVPPEMGARLVHLKGSFNLPADARVTLKVAASNHVKLQIDGREILYLKPYQETLSGEKRVDLPAGDHRVVYDTYLQGPREIPEISMWIDGKQVGLMGGPAQNSTFAGGH